MFLWFILYQDECRPPLIEYESRHTKWFILQSTRPWLYTYDATIFTVYLLKLIWESRLVGSFKGMEVRDKALVRDFFYRVKKKIHAFWKMFYPQGKKIREWVKRGLCTCMWGVRCEHFPTTAFCRRDFKSIYQGWKLVCVAERCVAEANR